MIKSKLTVLQCGNNIFCHYTNEKRAKPNNFFNKTKPFSVRMFWLPWDYVFRQKTIPFCKTIAHLSPKLTYDPLREQCYE